MTIIIGLPESCEASNHWRCLICGMRIGLLNSPANLRTTTAIHQVANEKLQRSITVIALFNFFIVSVVGLLLRAYPLYSVPIISFKNLLHAHSHFAFGGWVMPALLAMILKYFPEIAALVSSRHLRNICLMLFVSSYGMLMSFPFQGYALVSILFSSLSIGAGFYMAYIFWIVTSHCKQQVSIRFLRAGLFYLTISALGPFATGPLAAMGYTGSPIYFNSIYFFLHFQYNGWFTFAILAIIYKMLNLESRNSKWAFYLMSISCAPAYFLSTLWSHPGIVFNIVGGVAAGLQLIAACLIIQDFTRRKSFIQIKTGLFQLAVIFFVLKNVLQLASSFPEVADIAYRQRNFTIAYLHMVLLGFVTLFLLGAITEKTRTVNHQRLRTSTTLLIVSFLITEILLVINACGYNITIGPFRFHALMFIASGLLPLSIAMIWKETRLILSRTA